MPLTEDYAEPLKSISADFANVGGREAVPWWPPHPRQSSPRI